MEALYKGGKRSLDEWVQQVAFANPHARFFNQVVDNVAPRVLALFNQMVEHMEVCRGG